MSSNGRKQMCPSICICHFNKLALYDLIKTLTRASDELHSHIMLDLCVGKLYYIPRFEIQVIAENFGFLAQALKAMFCQFRRKSKRTKDFEARYNFELTK